MAYQKQTWEDLPSQNTPITASRLNHIENGIADVETSLTPVTSYTETNNKSYACNYVNGVVEDLEDSIQDIYSTDEVKTNKVYVDGNGVEHDVYRKVIRGTKGNDDLDLGIVSNDLTRVTETKGILIDTSNNKKALPYFYSTTIWLSYEINSLKKLVLYGATSQYSKGDVEITVEYTKD